MSVVSVRGRANRLRVFGYVKRAMEATGECPTAAAVSAAIGLGPRTVAYHMCALRHADGLPFAIPEGAQRAVAEWHRRGAPCPHDPVPIDTLMRNGGTW